MPGSDRPITTSDRAALSRLALLTAIRERDEAQAQVAMLVDAAKAVTERPGAYDSGGSAWWDAHDALSVALADLASAAQAHDTRIASEAVEGARNEAGEALFSMAFAAAGREHLDHGAVPFSSLVGCSEFYCRARAEDLLAAIAAGIATLRPEDEYLLSDPASEPPKDRLTTPKLGKPDPSKEGQP